jgi:hypothetical protein
VAWTTLLRSAELHSAVSPNCIRQAVGELQTRLVGRKTMQVTARQSEFRCARSLMVSADLGQKQNRLRLTVVGLFLLT